MWQQQPTTAAPPARSIASLVLLSAIATHIAALDVGRVSKIPITTAIIIPIKNGVNSVARAMPSPSFAKSQVTGGQSVTATTPATSIAKSGSTIISSFVLPATREQISAEIKAAR